MKYQVWSAHNEFIGTLYAISDENAIQQAKDLTPAPMVRSEWLSRNPFRG